LSKFFTLFHSKFEMPIYMKVVSLNKLDNFHKCRFLSVWVNFGERGKSSGRHLGLLWFEWGLTKALSTRSKASLELVGEFFEVRTQVDRDLTIVNRVDRRLGLIKTWGVTASSSVSEVASSSV
jgi:hypothetical protein